MTAARVWRAPGRVKLSGGPPVSPAVASAAVDALERLTSPGAPRWAAVGWAAALVGPWRDLPRALDDGSSLRSDLDSLLTRLDPAPARRELLQWLGQAAGTRTWTCCSRWARRRASGGRGWSVTYRQRRGTWW